MKEITAADFEAEVLNGKKVVLDFYSTECPPCEALAPKFESLAELYGNDIKFFKIFRQQNRSLAEQLGVKSSPTLLFFDNGVEVGRRLQGGIKRSEIIEQLNSMLSVERVNEIKSKIIPITSYFDVVIIGGGPGGLAAGLYLCQAKINTAIIDTALPGGHVSMTHEISNYPGFIEPVPGYMLSHYMSEQTKLCGTTIKAAVDVTKIDLLGKEIIIDGYETIKAKKIIIATGTKPNLTNVPGEKDLLGKGISFCATCDAKYYENKEVIVIGGGNSAVEEAEFISKFAKQITIVHQLDKFTANKKAQDKILTNPKIQILYEHEPRKFEKRNEKIVTFLEDLKTYELKSIIADGIFIFIGYKPNTQLFLDAPLNFDKLGFILTDDEMRTNIPDVYAVGDIVSKKFRQITTAVADGTIAAMSITKDFD